MERKKERERERVPKYFSILLFLLLYSPSRATGSSPPPPYYSCAFKRPRMAEKMLNGFIDRGP